MTPNGHNPPVPSKSSLVDYLLDRTLLHSHLSAWESILAAPQPQSLSITTTPAGTGPCRLDPHHYFEYVPVRHVIFTLKPWRYLDWEPSSKFSPASSSGFSTELEAHNLWRASLRPPQLKPRWVELR